MVYNVDSKLPNIPKDKHIVYGQCKVAELLLGHKRQDVVPVQLHFVLFPGVHDFLLESHEWF